MVACLAVLLSIAGCKTGGKLARVDASMILPESAARMQLEEKQVFMMPSEIEAPAPAFPVDYSIKDVDITVCAEFVVSAQGEVAEIRQIDDENECASPDSAFGRAFFSEVRSALSRWSYFAGAVCTFEIDEAECEGKEAILTPSSVRLAYRFHFLATKGKKSVRARMSGERQSSGAK